MIEQNDIRAAVSAGLLTEQQASGLLSLADKRRGARNDLARGDEPFELFKGFNEIFIVIGLLILSVGWMGVVGLALGDSIVDLQEYAMVVALIGAALLWLLSEYFVRKRRMIAPAIALSVMFASNAAFGFIAVMSEPFMIAQNDYSSVPLPLFIATLALLFYWWRFRVPFAMAMIAVGLFIVAIVYIKPRDFYRKFKEKGFKKFFKEDLIGSADSDIKKSMSIALGTFIGVSPFWGFHSILAIVLAAVFKLNKVISFAFSNISFPIFIPFILYGSLKFGGYILGRSSLEFEQIDENFKIGVYLLQYIVGSFALAIVMAILFGLIGFIYLQMFSSKKKQVHHG